MMKILLTRPREDSEALAKDIAARNLTPVIEPMTEIIFLPAEIPNLSSFSGLAFTSANAVRAFAKISHERDMPVYAVGQATAMEARQNGFTDVHDGGGTIETLNNLLARDNITNILHPGGVHIAAPVIADGKAAPHIALYEARAASSLSPALTESLRRGEIAKALFYSPRTAKIFATLVKKHGIAANIEHCTALCLSESVVNSLSDLPWKQIDVAAKPDQEHMLALLDA